MVSSSLPACRRKRYESTHSEVDTSDVEDRCECSTPNCVSSDGDFRDTKRLNSGELLLPVGADDVEGDNRGHSDKLSATSTRGGPAQGRRRSAKVAKDDDSLVGAHMKTTMSIATDPAFPSKVTAAAGATSPAET